MPIKHVSQAFSRLQKKIRNLQNRLQEDEKNIIPQAELPKAEDSQRMVVEVSLWGVTKTLFLVAAFYLAFSFLGRITSILVLLFISLFFAMTLSPGVNTLEKRFKMPRGVATIILMVFVLSAFLLILGGVIPIFAVEFAKIWAALTEFVTKLSQEDFSSLPIWMREIIEEAVPVIQDYFRRISPEELQSTIANFAKDNLGEYLSQVGNIVGGGISLLFTLFGGVFQAILVLVLTFFLVLEKGQMSKFFVGLFPKKYHTYLIHKGNEVETKITEWVHGQVMLFLIVGGIAYVGLTILGIEYALTLALIAGLAEFIPYVGPAIAFASAAPVAFNVSFSIGVATMIFYAFLQALEGNIIIPLVMKKAVGIPPVVTIIAMLIGWEFLGIIGMILAIPIASVLSLFVDDYSVYVEGNRKKKTKK